MLLCNTNIIQTAVNWEFPDFCHLRKKQIETLHLILAFFSHHATTLCRNSLEKRSAKRPHAPEGNGREPYGQSLRPQNWRNSSIRPKSPVAKRPEPLHPPHILTLAVGALLRAFASSLLALSYSLFSDSSFTAASQISSLLGLACKNTKWQTNAYSESTADLILRLIQIKIEIRALSIHSRIFFSASSSQSSLTFEVYRNPPKQMGNTKIYASLEVGCFSTVEKQ